MLRRLAAVAACLLSSQAHAVPTPRHATVVVQLSTEDLAQGQATTPLPDLGDVIIRTLSSTSTEFSSEFFARGIAWHKSGSVMMRESLNAINDYLASLLKGGAIVAAPGVSSSKDVRVGIIADSGNGINLTQSGADAGVYHSFDGYPRTARPPPSARFFTIYRNPIEMAVSELSYDIETPESYTWLYPLDQTGIASCRRDTSAAQVSLLKNGSHYCDGLHGVMMASETYLKGVLPAPNGDNCERACREPAAPLILHPETIHTRHTRRPFPLLRSSPTD